jgi:hypothetical protein
VSYVRKYQIFISSTFEDLKEARSAVVRAVLEMGHIPVGMEMFSAADEQQWDIISRTIDQSDYYVVIVGHRYGSVTEDGVSYTEKEFRYARSRGIPILGFILSPDVAWPPEFVDTDSAAKTALEDFKGLVRERPVGFWASLEDLHGKCSIALMKAFTATPREGWVPGGSAASPELTAELTRLSAEAADLRKQLGEIRARSAEEEEARYRHTLRTLRARERTPSFKADITDPEWTDGEKLNLFDVFTWIAPTLLTEDELDVIMSLIVLHARGDDESLKHVPTNWAQGLLADLAAFGLVEPSSRRKSVHDKGEYWSLTEEGAEIYKFLRRERLEKELNEEASQEAGRTGEDVILEAGDES